ncbi:MAG: hypothetical protein SOT46_04000 [Treponema sp.]|nr:hypothetical protein [Spirochaetia bacterium]MDY2839517.1 hypothetical protein [Treponema sp.]MDY5122712.1 hypothetical protein [Treponema sp.]
MKKHILIFTAFLISFSIFAQTHTSSQAHQEQVTNIICIPGLLDNSSYMSSGEDGFLIKWSENNLGEHYQISDVGIKLIAYSPNGTDVAVYESDGGSVNKVSVWNWKTLTRKYQKKFNDSITSLAFSAKGTYLIIGTATVDGAVFVKTSDWQIVDKIKTNTSIVSYINTSDTEKTCVFYSPSGSLSYYSMGNGQLKQKFSIISGLTNVVMFNNNIFIAGVKDNQIYIINAYKGETVAAINAHNPIILSTNKDSNLYYIEYDGKTLYEIKMLENLENQTVSNPRLVRTLRGPRGNAAICAGTKNYVDIFLGGKNGAIYKVEVEPSTVTNNLEEITENTYAKIYDMDISDSSFYFLTENKIYESSYDTELIIEKADVNGENQIITYDSENVILWSKSTRNSVKLMNLSSKETKELFIPKNTIQSVRLCTVHDSKYLIEIESNTTVNIYDFESQKFYEIYSGTGVQDAVITNNKYVYIAKSAATNPKVPMLSVNLETLETVPLSLKGNVAYGLSTDGNIIYGVNLISDNSGKSTYVFSFNTNTKTFTNILKFADEDSEAFTYLNGSNLFTNIGKNKIYCYNLSTKKRFSYNRSASIPKSICQKNNRVVILNNNGSISWCGPSSSTLLADWYLTKDQNWIEF